MHVAGGETITWRGARRVCTTVGFFFRQVGRKPGSVYEQSVLVVERRKRKRRRVHALEDNLDGRRASDLEQGVYLVSFVGRRGWGGTRG